MPIPKQTAQLFRRELKGEQKLSAAEREQLLKPYLPPPPSAVSASASPSSRSPSRGAASAKRGSRHSKTGPGGKPVHTASHRPAKIRSRAGLRHFLSSQVYFLLFVIIHSFFSLYIRFRQGYHGVRDRVYSVLKYHHRTPEIIARDVRDLKRLPKHLSVILRLEEGGRGGSELERLVNDVSDIASWCASVGIPKLSVYERTGILKSYIPETHRAVSQRLAAYFGRVHPAVTLQAPHVPSIESTMSPRAREYGDSDEGHIRIMLLSEEDGRDSLVDLTKTLAEMAQRSKISPSDISTDLVDAELTESVMEEPDLLILFGPHVELMGYPPWQIRLTEIYHAPDNQTVGYQVFLWGLQNYAKAEFRVGK